MKEYPTKTDRYANILISVFFCVTTALIGSLLTTVYLNPEASTPNKFIVLMMAMMAIIDSFSLWMIAYIHSNRTENSFIPGCFIRQSLDRDMETLDVNSTRLFLHLVQEIKLGQTVTRVRGENELEIKKVANFLISEGETTTVYSEYRIFNKKLADGPDMSFLSIDRSREAVDHHSSTIIPLRRELFKGRILEISGYLLSNVANLTVFQNESAGLHCRFANEWFSDLKQQGFLN